MRQFLLGIIATVVGGFALFWLTNWYALWSAEEKYKVEYSVNAAAGFIGNDELSAIISIADKKGSSGKIAIVTIRNPSENDITDAEFLISPTISSFTVDNLHGFDLASYENGDMPAPKISRVPEGIKIEFPVLAKNNGASFWIAHEPPQNFKIYSKTKGLKLIDQGDYNYRSSLDFPFVILIGLLCLFIGGWISSAINKDIIKKAGHDPKKIMADYYRALAKEQEKKEDDANE